MATDSFDIINTGVESKGDYDVTSLQVTHRNVRGCQWFLPALTLTHDGYIVELLYLIDNYIFHCLKYALCSLFPISLRNRNACFLEWSHQDGHAFLISKLA